MYQSVGHPRKDFHIDGWDSVSKSNIDGTKKFNDIKNKEKGKSFPPNGLFNVNK